MQFLAQLRNLFGVTAAPAAPAAAGAASAGPGRIDGAHRHDLVYPPRDPGLPLADVQTSIRGQDEFLRRLKIHAAIGDAFQVRFAEPVERLAAYVSSLPSGPHGIFSGPGGLFRASVEMGFHCFQLADSKVFSVKSGVEERHLMEGRWRYVCFAAGLLWPVGATLEAIRVRGSDGKPWSPRKESILDWARSAGIDAVHFSWSGDPQPGPASTGAAIALDIVGRDNIGWLEEANPILTSALTGIASGVKDVRYEVAYGVVDSMWRRVIEAEKARRPETYGRLSYGSNAAPHIVDALASLVTDGKWKVGTAPFFVDYLGIYLQWPMAAQEIAAEFDRRGVVGMPRTPSGLLTMMEEAGILKAGKDGPLVDIADAEGEIAAAVMLARPNTVMPDFQAEDFKSARMVLLKSIVQSDPVSQAKSSKQPPVAAISTVAEEAQQDDEDDGQIAPPPAAGPSLLAASAPPATATPKAPVPAAATQKLAEPVKAAVPTPTLAASMAAEMAQQAPKSETPAVAAKSQGASKTTESVAEGEVVSYLDHLSDQWKVHLKRREGEIVGRIVSLIKAGERPGEYAVHPNGLAVSFELLGDLVTDISTFLQNVAATGMLFTHPSTPGKLVHDHVFSDGEKKRRCVVIAQFAAKQLGISQ